MRALPLANWGSWRVLCSLAISQLRLGVGVAPAQRTAVPAPRSGGLVDIDAAADEFPMRIGGVPAPWEPGGKTTRQMVLEGSLKLSLTESVVANVALATLQRPTTSSRRCELADVRLSAGDGTRTTPRTKPA